MMNRRGLLRYALLGGAWAIPSGSRAVEATPGHRGGITSLAVSGETVYSVSQAGVFLNWQPLVRPRWRVIALALRHQRMWLAGGLPGEVGHLARFDFRSKTLSAPREVGKDLIYDLTLNREGDRLVWGDAEGRIRSVESLKWSSAAVRDHAAHQGAVRVIAVAPQEDRVASGGLDGAVLLQSLGENGRIQRLQEHTAGVESLAFSPDGQWLASGSRDARVRVHRVEDGRLMRTYRGLGMEGEPPVGRLPTRVLALAWEALGPKQWRLIAGTSSGGLYLLSEEDSSWKKWGQLVVGPLSSFARKGDQLVIGSAAHLPVYYALK